MTSVDTEYTNLTWGQVPQEIAKCLNIGKLDEASKILNCAEAIFKKTEKTEFKDEDLHCKVIRELVQIADLKKIIDLAKTYFSVYNRSYLRFILELKEKFIQQKDDKYLEVVLNLVNCLQHGVNRSTVLFGIMKSCIDIGDDENAVKVALFDDDFFNLIFILIEKKYFERAEKLIEKHSDTISNSDKGSLLDELFRRYSLSGDLNFLKLAWILKAKTPDEALHEKIDLPELPPVAPPPPFPKP